MSKKPDTAAALAGILKAKREPVAPAAPAPAIAETPEPAAPAAIPVSAPSPSPALPPMAPVSQSKAAGPKAKSGKSSDPNYRQFSVWLRKDTRKKVGRALDDADTGQDFSELVQEL